MFCGKCGNKLNKNSKFCGVCGHKTKQETKNTEIPKKTEKLVNDEKSFTKFCGKCGSKLNNNSNFCGTCGHDQNKSIKKEIKSNKEQIKENKPKEKKESKILNNIKNVFAKIKNFIVKHKVILLISLASIVLISVGVFLFFKFYDFTKISWDKKYGDYNVNYTGATTLKLKVNAYDKEDELIRKITFEVTGGEVESNGSIVEWKLPEKDGTYTITAKAPSGKKITKEVKVINQNINEPIFSSIEEEEYDEKADYDEDGLINKEEKELGTDLYFQDTDLDGLTDYYEVNESKTDPLKADSDDDELNDGNEIVLGLDPLKKSTYDDDILDGKRELTYKLTNENANLELTGKGNIAFATIDIFENETLKERTGILDKVYFYYSDADITNAKISISYNLDEVLANNLVEDNLTIYSFDDETKELKALETNIDKENKIVSTTTKNLGKFLLGNVVDDTLNKKTQILAVIDNSLSMYGGQQMIDQGLEGRNKDDVGSDEEFKRLTLTNEMVDLFEGNYEFGISTFAGEYKNLYEFGTEKDKIKEAVNSMKFNWVTSHGTNIKAALTEGLAEFEDTNLVNYLILLTDGQNTTGNLSRNKNSIISTAKENNIRVCVIGLGHDVDADILTEIANETGCGYYHASKDTALDEIYSLIGAEINYSYVDTDEDSETDGMILYDSGFVVTRDGFNFENYTTLQSRVGNCYGMATFAMLYYMDILPNKLGSLDTETLKNDLEIALGYNIENTYFDKDNSLYDYQFETNILNYYFKERPSDYRDRIENDVFLIKEDYYELYDEAGVKFENIEAINQEFSYWQSANLDLNSDKLKENITNDEYQLLNAIYRLYVTQTNDESIYFRFDPTKAFEQLKNDLQSGKPTIISFYVKNVGGHTVNAIKLIQDNENANQFKLAIYDSNFPGKVRYIKITRHTSFNIDSPFEIFQYKFEYDLSGDGDYKKLKDVNISYPIIE